MLHQTNSSADFAPFVVNRATEQLELVQEEKQVAFFECIEDFFEGVPVADSVKAIQILIDSVVYEYDFQTKTALEVSKIGLFLAQLSSRYEMLKHSTVLQNS